MKSQPSKVTVSEGKGHNEAKRMNAARSARGVQVIGFALALCLIPVIASAQEPDQSSQEPQPPAVERADQLNSKVTFAVYLLPHETGYDLNLRHKFGSVVAWIGGFYDPRGGSLGRIGAEYDYQREWLLLIPTLQVANNGAVSGMLYSELGTDYYGILGFARTNLRPFSDLFFDPSESVQIGFGRKIDSYDKLYGFTIFDVRLHTRQQNTHILWRHRIDENNGITFDGLYKSGNRDDGKHIRDVGIGVYYDRPSWFWKAYYDRSVNFTRQKMIRIGVGLKF